MVEDRRARKLRRVKSKNEMRCTDPIQHETDLVEGAIPHKESSRRLSPENQRQPSEQVEELLEKGVIEPSKSPWGSGIVMVTKKGTTELRMCGDFRNLNACTVKDAYPLPRTDDSITNLGDAKYFTLTSRHLQSVLASHHERGR